MRVVVAGIADGISANDAGGLDLINAFPEWFSVDEFPTNIGVPIFVMLERLPGDDDEPELTITAHHNGRTWPPLSAPIDLDRGRGFAQDAPRYCGTFDSYPLVIESLGRYEFAVALDGVQRWVIALGIKLAEN